MNDILFILCVFEGDLAHLNSEVVPDLFQELPSTDLEVFLVLFLLLKHLFY